MKTMIMAAVGLVMAGSAVAGPLEKWTGTGAVYSPNGVELSNYALTVENTEVGPHQLESKRVMTLPDGTQKVMTQKIATGSEAWQSESDLGSGGGACYGDGLCENYLEDANGEAWATTLVSDGPNARRAVTIRLLHGKAIKVYRDKLVRVQ